ncbi:MAG: alpha-2-macroglobulin family protein, partial [Planctomycetia bacterium]|nr:alpha-2-macroglobulin family protein [Planctomycetia bacterium]
MNVLLPGGDGDEQSQESLGMKAKQMRLPGSGMGYAEGRESLMEQSAGMPRASRAGLFLTDASGSMAKGASSGPGPKVVQPVVRKKFADTALWVAALETDKNGEAEVELTMPENLTTWKTKVWALGNGTRVGQAETEVITTKDLIIRLQAPRFFVQKDEVVLSAIVHNYLKTKKNVQVVLEMKGGCMEPLGVAITGEWNLQHVLLPPKTIEIAAGGEARVDWRVKVVQPGEATITMKALTDEESDAMQMTFPVYIHGMLKTESFSGVIRPEKQRASVDIRVPKERLPEQSRLEIRYSPTLAGAMVDALPYLVSYPYGCTEQTLNRFLPTVITQKVLLRMGLDLKAIRDKRTNLNAQEIGDDRERAKQWKRFDHNPVFDEELVADMVKAGVEKLASMQCSDGGWGWFSGWGERSWPHTTAVVVHGLQIARENDVALIPGVLERGIAWLKRYQAEQVRQLKNWPKKIKPRKKFADNLDAFVYMVLVDQKKDNKEMRDFLYRDRNHLAVYAKAMFAMALHNVKDIKKRDMLIRNVEQFLVQDDENQTAYLKLPANNWWWYWYGSEYEAQAYYLKLLALTNPKSETASRLVKYLINNRKHATYWKSTRDTAVCIEAFADYIKASGEDKPDMTLTILIDGKAVKEVKINAENLFTFDNKVVLVGKEVTTGKHKIELVRKGTGPVYFNAYLTNFTLEDPITRAGLEIKVRRKYYKLVRVDKEINVRGGARGQAVGQKVEKYKRLPLKNLALLKSGDLVEIELEIESKNDYEYIMFEDMKAAGFEPVDVRSGYRRSGMGAYIELRDERVTFFVRRLARGKHSISYRIRAEIPGRFSALPTKASAMYAPELKANSDEIKLRIED